MQVYDEKCLTKYPAKCVKEQDCTMVYRTMCAMEGYSQQCRQVPSEHCVPVTKCHRIPKTQCKPIKEKECGNVQVQVPTRQMVYRCEPFEPRQEENLDGCMGMMAGNDMFPPPPDTGYGPPEGSAPNYNGIDTSAGAQQVPGAQYTTPTQSFNIDPGLSQSLQNTYTSTQNLNAPTQTFAQTIPNHNNALPTTYTGTQQTFQQQALNAPSVSNYNSGSTFPVQQQQQNNFGGTQFNQQQPSDNTYSANSISQTPLLTPQAQLQQPFINTNNPTQIFSAPSSYISPLSSNVAIQTPFAPGLNSNSNNQGDFNVAE